ncbi:hypothetical protein GX441_01990 [bacterium]|nr:hypothetical protein [bacterium]
MHILLALRLFSLVALATPAQQADALLSYITFPQSSLYEWKTAMDDSGYVWMAGIYKEIFINRIDSHGHKVIDETILPRQFGAHQSILFDKWCILRPSESGHVECLEVE